MNTYDSFSNSIFINIACGTTKNCSGTTTSLQLLDCCEYLLSKKLRDLGNEKEEHFKNESTKVLHYLGNIYRGRSPHKHAIIKAVILYNAALLRNPDNKENIRNDLHEVCQQVLKLANAKCADVSLVQKADALKQDIRDFREDVQHLLESLDFSEMKDYYSEDFLRNLVPALESLQISIYEWYCNLMKNVYDISVDVLGDPPCQYAVIGMGSLARKEITPYSDFEHAILLEDGVQHRKDYQKIIEYFRWVSVVSNILVINLGETIVKCAALPYLNNDISKHFYWFYDISTTKGISFDGMSCQASKSPLGRPETPEKPWKLELIKPISKMLEFLSSVEDSKNGYHLADILMSTCFVSGNEKLHEDFQKGVKRKTDTCTSKDLLRNQLKDDIENFNAITRLSQASREKTFDIKRVIYRSVTLFLTALGRYYQVFEDSSFVKIRKLAKMEVFDKTFADDLMITVAIACKVRLEIYMENGSQEDCHIRIENSPLNVYIKQIMTVETSVKFFTTVMKLQRDVFKNIGSGSSNFVQWSPELDRLLASFWLQNYEIASWEWENQAKAITCSENVSKTANEVLIETGRIYFNMNEYRKAFQCFKRMKTRIKQLHPQKCHIETHYFVYCIGLCFEGLADKERCFKYFQKAINEKKQQTKDHKTDDILSLYYHDAGACLHELGKHADAKVCFEMAISIQKEINHVHISSSLN